MLTMKTVAAIITVFGAILLENVNGVSTKPGSGVVCTMDYKICANGQYLGTGSNGCPACLPCPMVKLAACPDGSSPVLNPRVENECPTHSCPEEPVMCTMDIKVCTNSQYLGTGSSGCPECLPCPMVKLGACPDGSSPVLNPQVENECPTHSCPEEPVMCTMDYKICAQDQFLGTGDSGCPECLPCPMVKLAACPDGSSPLLDPQVENQCPTHSCPKEPVMCTMDYKICAQDQFLGTGDSGCPECLPCPMVKLAACPDGSSPLLDPQVENQCPTHSCPKEPVMCTMDYKICAQDQFLGTGDSGCPECLPCPMVKLAACPDGSYPLLDPQVENQCPTHSCPKEPVMCTKEYKICARGQYLGTGDSGCPECLQCPQVRLAPCPNGTFPRERAYVQNKCPSYYCPTRRWNRSFWRFLFKN